MHLNRMKFSTEEVNDSKDAVFTSMRQRIYKYTLLFIVNSFLQRHRAKTWSICSRTWVLLKHILSFKTFIIK